MQQQAAALVFRANSARYRLCPSCLRSGSVSFGKGLEHSSAGRSIAGFRYRVLNASTKTEASPNSEQFDITFWTPLESAKPRRILVRMVLGRFFYCDKGGVLGRRSGPKF